ncbi:MAG: PD-(D/E)XK nuclease family protein, partial [Epsilonproteobacteria bacterium]
KRRMNEFCTNEIERFRDAWRVKYCEKSIECDFAGMRLSGIIDRIDMKDEELSVLDYKTGSYPLYTAKTFTDATDFQLEFYYLLASTLGRVSSCGYYDLKDSKIVPEALLEEKLAILESHIKDLLNIEDVNFEMTEDVKSCLFCEFKIMCGRE